MRRLKTMFLVLLSLLMINSYFTLPVFALSLGSRTLALDTSGACAGLTQVGNGQDCTSKGSGVTNVIKAAVTILSIIAGAAAIIMIIVGGLKYITSGGDSNAVSSAKSTLIYALIGVAVAAIAQFLVHFVLTTSNNSVSG